jgi:putative molybdopterin biosynthesis protein
VLLDFELKRLGINANSINGYEREEFTHMSVGVAIASSLADAGLAVRAAAQALNLDFVPIAREQYDLLFLRSFFESDRGQRLMRVLRSGAFKDAVAALGGYDSSDSGKLLYEQ